MNVYVKQRNENTLPINWKERKILYLQICVKVGGIK